MTDIDCDDFGIESAMHRATRIRWMNSRTVPYVAVNLDDCAPGLEMEPGDDWIRRDSGGAALSALCRLTDYDCDR